MDVILNKIESIKRCIRRIREEYNNLEENLHNFTKQDSIVLNLQRFLDYDQNNIYFQF